MVYGIGISNIQHIILVTFDSQVTKSLKSDMTCDTYWFWPILFNALNG